MTAIQIPENRERRLKNFRCSRDFVTTFLRGDTRPAKWIDSPEDLEVIGIWSQSWNDSVDIYVYSKSYPILTEGEIPPYVDFTQSTENECPEGFEGLRPAIYKDWIPFVFLKPDKDDMYLVHYLSSIDGKETIGICWYSPIENQWRPEESLNTPLKNPIEKKLYWMSLPESPKQE